MITRWLQSAATLGSTIALMLVSFSACQTKKAAPAREPERPSAWQPPADSELPNDEVGRSARRGLALLVSTRDSLPNNVGNALRCVSCHPDNGRRPNAMPWIGVYARFPQYRSRSGTVNIIEDRINDCFERSMNGKALEPRGRDMRDIVAYMAFLSRGVPVGAPVPGQGLPKLDVTSGDSAAGSRLYAATCSPCHGPGGQGTPVAPPVWGPRSFNVGAGMARARTAAAFIRRTMPYDRPGSLTDQQAFDVARYITSQPRPDFRGKERDWPNGDPPPDVAYPTDAADQKAGGTTPESPRR